MNRDAFLATLIGLALGLTITGLLLVGPQLVKSFPHITLPSLSFLPSPPKETSQSTAPKPISFAVESPLPEAIETNSQLVVSGSAPPQAMVVISGPVDDDVVTVGADAKFAGKITLSEGKNDITVTQYLKGKPTSSTVSVYYTPENF